MRIRMHVTRRAVEWNMIPQKSHVERLTDCQRGRESPPELKSVSSPGVHHHARARAHTHNWNGAIAITRAHKHNREAV
jgi:hypothetical protein